MRPVRALFGAVASLVIGASASADGAARWELPCAYPGGSFQSQNLVEFAAAVEKATGGRLKITVHVNGTLFPGPQILRAVQDGKAQIGEVLLADFGNESPIYAADSLPFLAQDYPQAARLWQLQKPVLDRELKSRGLFALYAVPWPPQGLFSLRPLATAADLKGAKWSAATASAVHLGEILGAQTVPWRATDVSQSTPVADATVASASAGWDAKTYLRLKFWYDTRMALPKNAVIVNQPAFAALYKPDQETLLRLAAQAEARGWAASRQAESEAQAMLKSRDAKVLEPPAGLASDFRQAGLKLLDEWLRHAGPEGQDLVDAYRR